MEKQVVWGQAGKQMQLGPGGLFWAAISKKDWPEDEDVQEEIKRVWEEPYGDRRQELVFIGADVNRAKIVEALDWCALTDREFEKGPESWKKIHDPIDIIDDDEEEEEEEDDDDEDDDDEDDEGDEDGEDEGGDGEGEGEDEEEGAKAVEVKRPRRAAAAKASAGAKPTQAQMHAAPAAQGGRKRGARETAGSARSKPAKSSKTASHSHGGVECHGDHSELKTVGAASYFVRANGKAKKVRVVLPLLSR